MAAVGRPTDFNEALADQLCERLINGESLRKICRDDDMPSASTVCRWLSQNEAFREQYAHARVAQADTLADEILDIADDSSADETEGSVNHEIVQRSRLRIDARKWLAAKMSPKRYGDKVALTGGDENDKPLTVVIRKPE